MNFKKNILTLVCAGVFLAVFFTVQNAAADFELPPFAYVTIVNQNLGGENDFEFVLQKKTDAGFEFTGQTMSTDPDSDNYIGNGKFWALEVSRGGEAYRIFEYPPADNWISVSVSCVSDNPGTTFNPAANGVDIYPAYKQDSHIVCTFANINGVPVDKFVYVALGDSYQSGEGAGNPTADTGNYLTKAYENGNNYPWIINGQPVGGQTNTYIEEIIDNRVAGKGNGCHRALENYAKTIRDKLKPGAEVLLVDQTCSGAKIESGDRPPVVGDMAAGVIAANSQVALAQSQLALAGLAASDVDLVTVGMGGNDARFVEIVEACLFPNILRQALQNYPNPPAEIKTLVDMFGSCKNVDALFFKTDEAIARLEQKEVWAQNKLLETFSNARVMQVNYPNILPQNTKSLAWCGGIRKEDINYARGKVNSINKKINAALTAVKANNPRLELADTANAFGDNPLCPANPESALINSINKNNFNAEIERLLNLDGNGDAQSRALIDQLVAEYGEWKQCWATHLNLLDNGADCDTGAAQGQLNNSFQTLLLYFQDSQSQILADLVVPKNLENDFIRYDRSKGLFHPNLNGHKITACNVLAAYQKTDPGVCRLPDRQAVDKVNGNVAGNTPVNAAAGGQMYLHFNGFAPNTAVAVTILSVPQNIAAVTSDNDGVVEAAITLPQAAPGVHTIILDGLAANGAAMAKQFRVDYPGDPAAGSTYGMYFGGFTPNDGNNAAENVEINYGGQVFAELVADEDGGVFVELPVVAGQGPLPVAARGGITGAVVEQTVHPAKTFLPLAPFVIKDAQIKWPAAAPKNGKKNPEFMITGRFELPAGVSRADLDKAAVFSLTLDGKTAAARIDFKEAGNLWKYKTGNGLPETKINSALVYWSPEKDFCAQNKTCVKELKNKNWFYVRGELDSGLDINALPKIDVKFELAAPSRNAVLGGSQGIDMKKTSRRWFYHSPLTWKHWPGIWWYPWDNFNW